MSMDRIRELERQVERLRAACTEAHRILRMHGAGTEAEASASIVLRDALADDWLDNLSTESDSAVPVPPRPWED